MRIIDLADLFENQPYIMVGVGGDIFAMGPFDTIEIALENVKRLVATDSKSNTSMLDGVVFCGIGKLSQIDLIRYNMQHVSGDVFAEKLPWEES